MESKDMANENIKQVMQDAVLDADSLERFINGSDSETVLTRLSAEYPTLQKAIKELFENGGLPATPFKTKLDMESSSLEDGSYAVVTDSPNPTANGLYIKESGEWVKSSYNPTVAAVSSASNLVKTELSRFITLSDNLFNKNNVSHGLIVRDTGVIEQTGSDWVLSGFIKVEPNADYVCYADNNDIGYDYVSFYDKNKDFVLRVSQSSFGNAGDIKLILPNIKTHYIRISLKKSEVDLDTLMLVKGRDRLDYVSGTNELNNVSLSDSLKDNIKDIIKSEGSVADDYITEYNNLFDYRKATEGYLVSAEGEVVESSTDYSVSDFIPVEPNAKYTISGQVGVGINAFTSTALYDSGMQFLRRISTSNASAPNSRLTITIPSDTHYVRLNTNNGKPFERSRMFNKGSEALPYDTGGAELSNLRLSGDIINQVKSELDFSGGGVSNSKYLIDMEINIPFSTDVVWDEYKDTWRRQKTSEQIYQMFDALLANNTDYMSKQFLANDAVGNRIELYKLRQPLGRIGGYSRKKPKIFMAVALHGYEQLSPLAVYLMCQQLCENWQSDPVLEAIRYNAELFIIPVTVPYGWDNFQRKNANGVDINRNFPRGHGMQSTDPISAYYGGEHPISEIESQCIKQVIDENPDIDVYMDCHNFAGVAGRRDYVWVANETSGTGEHLVQLLASRLDRKWRKEFDWYSDFGGRNPVYSTNKGGNGNSKGYAYDRGIEIPVTFEVCERWWVQGDDIDNRYDATHCKTAVEAYVNWLSIVLNYLTK